MSSRKRKALSRIWFTRKEKFRGNVKALKSRTLRWLIRLKKFFNRASRVKNNTWAQVVRNPLGCLGLNHSRHLI